MKRLTLLALACTLSCTGMERSQDAAAGAAPVDEEVLVKAIESVRPEREIDKISVDVNTRYMLRRRPLHWAALKGNTSVAQLLIKSGAQIDAQDMYKKTSLLYSVEKGHLGVAEILLKAGARVNTKDEFGYSPLHLAALGAFQLSLYIAKLLIESGADVNTIDELGRTPLHWAASKGRVEIAQLLINHGANINARTQCGETALDICKEKRQGAIEQFGENYEAIEQLLISASADQTLS